jgi:hypothetical protein
MASMPPCHQHTGSEHTLESYDTAALRQLIAQSRRILRDRSCIPDARLRAQDTPALTGQERRTLAISIVCTSNALDRKEF